MFVCLLFIYLLWVFMSYAFGVREKCAGVSSLLLPSVLQGLNLGFPGWWEVLLPA